MPKLVQFGSGPLSVIDPTQAPPGKHTTYAWHVMPLTLDMDDRQYENFKAEFADRIIETFARYCPNMTSDNIIGRHVYTGREYAREMINMRIGDIFMGAFNAEQVMYNHFGYRTPVPHPVHGRLALPSGRRHSRRRWIRRRRNSLHATSASSPGGSRGMCVRPLRTLAEAA